jgi:hypothetical protein
MDFGLLNRNLALEKLYHVRFLRKGLLKFSVFQKELEKDWTLVEI